MRDSVLVRDAASGSAHASNQASTMPVAPAFTASVAMFAKSDS